MIDLLLWLINKVLKGGDTMTVIYATLIVKGTKTIDDVPAIIKDDVRLILLDLEIEV